MTNIYQYPCPDNHASCSPIEFYLKEGLYLFEVFGASGGSGNNSGRIDEGGKGGFSKGYYFVLEPTKVYLFIGGEGSYSTSSASLGGWNGGGNSKAYGGSGGGGTDIRFIGGSWNSPEGLNSRIIVGGGGGGAYGGTYCHSPGPSGGGMTGDYINYTFDCNPGDPEIPPISCYGTQTNCEGGIDSTQTRGGFGYGGLHSAIYSTGGGGGYWGGGSSQRGSGSGSGYIGKLISYKGSHPITVSGVNHGNGYIIISHIASGLCTFNNCLCMTTISFYVPFFVSLNTFCI